MKKPRQNKIKKTATPLPPGIIKYMGPSKGIKSRLREPANLTSGGSRTVHSVPTTPR